MKRTTIILLSVLLFAACQDENLLPRFEVDKPVITIGAEGGTEFLQVSSPTEWVAMSTEPWVSISPANGIGETRCNISIDSTLVDGARTATLYFRTLDEGDLRVSVNQLGFGKQIILEDSVLTIASSTNSLADRYFEATVTANIPFGIKVEYEESPLIEWITPSKVELELDRGSRPRTTTVRFDWKINTQFEERVAHIHFVPLNAEDILEHPAILTLTQEAAPTITDDRAGDSLALITIIDRLQLLSPWEVSENMQYWPNITLWEATDEEIISGEVPQAAIGRVRSADIMMCYTKESIPQEIRYLKYIETLNIYSNVNTMLLSIELGSEVCELEYLKHLQIGAFGLVSLPDEFVKLGDKLESLDLSSNNFEDIPAILTKENFPKLKRLYFIDCRRWTVTNLGNKDTHEDGIGLHFNANENDALKRLLLWDTLEELRLSNNYIEGQIPDFIVGQDGVEAWSQADVEAWGGDTIKNLVGMPKIMPNMKRLTLNLNFFTGKLPEWVLYHPHLLDWFPESLIYMQKENGIDSDGKLVKFDNEPTDYEYYYNFFPCYREKYEIKEEFED
jgi:hypothetical protein